MTAAFQLCNMDAGLGVGCGCMTRISHRTHQLEKFYMVWVYDQDQSLDTSTREVLHYIIGKNYKEIIIFVRNLKKIVKKSFEKLISGQMFYIREEISFFFFLSERGNQLTSIKNWLCDTMFDIKVLPLGNAKSKNTLTLNKF